MQVTLWTDGSSHLGTLHGGWAYAITRDDTLLSQDRGAATGTTNNRMELQAVIEALRCLKRPCDIDIYTDSQYVQKGISQWIHNWKRNGWRTADKKPVKNADLWQTLDTLTKTHEIKWLWVKGHAGHPGNERADSLANRGIDELLAGQG